MPVERPIRDYEAVKIWETSLRNQWGGDPLGEEPDLIANLEEFCAFVAEDPDTIIGKLFRIRKADGERVLSAKWRTHYAEKVKEYRVSAGGGTVGQRKGADVLSFMIHNGILIQA